MGGAGAARTPAVPVLVQAGRDDRHPDLVAEGVVDDRAEDDVRVDRGRVGDELSGLVDLEQAEVRTALDGQEHAVRAVDARLEQRARDGHLGRRDRAVVAARGAGAHQRRAGAGHDRLDVGEVQVDQPGRGDQVGDPLDTGEQHLVRGLERVQDAHVPVRDGQQPVVGDDDQRVDLAAQLLDAELGLHHPALALEAERPGHHADGERAEGPSHVRDHRRAAGAGAAALAGRDEDHVGALEHLLDLLAVIFGGLVADIGIGAGAQSPGELAADIELDVGVAHEQRLRVGINSDELDASESLFDHAIDGVDTATADSDDLDNRQIVLRCCHEEGTFPLVYSAISLAAISLAAIPAGVNSRRSRPWARETSVLFR